MGCNCGGSGANQPASVLQRDRATKSRQEPRSPRPRQPRAGGPGSAQGYYWTGTKSKPSEPAA